MCVVSMVGQHYSDKWTTPSNPMYPYTTFPSYPTPVNDPAFNPTLIPVNDLILQKQIDELKKEVQEMKELLTKAKSYDIANNEPDCEMDSKVEILKKVAKLFDVSLEDIFPETNTKGNKT